MLKGQGQLKAIIWTILVVFEYTLIHTKYSSNGYGEGFQRLLSYIGVAAILFM